MAQVFLSYSRRDWLIAEGLAANLNAMGYHVWIDTGIKPNVPYAEEIDRALNASQAAIVIWTQNSIASDWVLWEARRALDAAKLVQLRVPELQLDRIPQPFTNFTIYHEGGPEEVDRRISDVIRARQLGDASPAGSTPSPPLPSPRGISDQSAPSRYSVLNLYLYSFSLLGLGALLLLGQFSWYLATTAVAAGMALLILILLYSAYLSVSRFTDRFGRAMAFEALVFGMLASLFAGAVGGYPYASTHIERLPGVSTSDLFIIKYVRVIVITTLVGTILSYLLLALVRYIHLRHRNLGPAWSQRDATLQIAIPVSLVVVLGFGAALLANNLPSIGFALDKMTSGRIYWLGSGQCPSIDYCVPPGATTYCSNCTVGDESKADIVLILATFLWSQHVFHMKKFGASFFRILISSVPIIAATIFMVCMFELYPDAFGKTAAISGWQILIWQVPWIFLIFWTVFTVTRSAASVDRRAIVDRDA